MFLRFIHVILENELGVCHFSWLSNILLYSHHTVCLSIHQVIDLDSLWIVYSIFWIVYCESAMNICLILEWTQFFLTTLLGCYWYTINHTNLNHTIWWILMYVYTPETIMHNQDNEYIHHPSCFFVLLPLESFSPSSRQATLRQPWICCHYRLVSIF